MDITEVKVFPVNEEKLKAYVTVIFDNCFVVRDLKIINGNTGLFVAMPSKKRKDGTFRDIAHPLNSELRTLIEKKVLAAYEDELKKMSSAAAESIKALGQRKRDYDDEGP
ncbi:MAG: septation regulator SpoVG [Proteobacteria bacterium]|nr:septation regulator SpoVG [Pseudomonadota bacterium]NDC24924.1 septation regulator SpoVG [Pseudomonadota bacterium]NDD05378.1 septation regulator SpoVG [Pseudomonadota bacterium]NDG27412.1 septation regulator SpoVG [Pseudomonadota bacterium]